MAARKSFISRSLPYLFPTFSCLTILLALYLLFRRFVQVEVLYIFAFLPTAYLTYRYRWNRVLLWALLSPIFISLSVPSTNWNWLMFIGLIPLLIALGNSKSLLESLYFTFCFSIAYFFIINDFIVQAISNICETNTFTSTILFLPFALAMMWKFIVLCVLFWLNRRYLSVPNVIFLPVVMGAVEFAKFELYPWTFALNLGEQLHLLQLADITGPAGISFLIMLFNVIGLHLWEFFRKERNSLNFRELAAGAVLLILWFSYGHFRLLEVRGHISEAPGIDIAVVQPNSPAGVRDSDEETNLEICETLRMLSTDLLQNCTPDLMVFPEGAGAMGYFVDVNPIFRETYSAIAREASCPLIVDNYSPVQVDSGWIIYRTALLLSPDDQVAGQYHKQKLVPFGEYIPLVGHLSFLRFIFKNIGGRSITRPGTDFPVWSIGGVSLAPQMCFEATYPGIARRSVLEGADLLVNISNDAWYGGGKEPEQHLKLSLLRCIENRVPMVRSTNTGISAYILPTGEILGDVSPINEKWTDCRSVPVPSISSFYTRHGEIFAWLCILCIMFIFVFSALRKLRR